jgi:hypothetical protein
MALTRWLEASDMDRPKSCCTRPHKAVLDAEFVPTNKSQILDGGKPVGQCPRLAEKSKMIRGRAVALPVVTRPREEPTPIATNARS